eukprot:CAMPEP_0202697558 /NCGR_PEP_ID=MMETSP1385-20130828/10910_1 /ASSEMBLY_ACC=CAM_ASM_000861 /TAXON_ID=933848 /ORGANISM="Elphidium margaritaceum" /LENGTH=390 /DNA_ID=CAMNT_0049354057 /DNA_START=52 /DNA_END=1224 /DNA_ORIENTATION=-
MAALPVSAPFESFDVLFDYGFMEAVRNEETVFRGGLDKALRALWEILQKKAKGADKAPICPENFDFWNKAIPLVRGDSGAVKLKDLAAVQELPDVEKTLPVLSLKERLKSIGKKESPELKNNAKLNHVLTVLLDVVNNNIWSDGPRVVNIDSAVYHNVMGYFEKVDGKWKLKAEPGDITVSQLLLPPIKGARRVFKRNVWNDYSKSKEFQEWLTKTKSGKLVAPAQEKWAEDAAKKRAEEAEKLAHQKVDGGAPMSLSAMFGKKSHTGYDNQLNLDYGGYQQPPQYQVQHYPYFDGYGSSRRQDVMVLPPQSNGYYVMPPDQFAVGGMAPGYSAYQDNALLLVLLMLVLALFGCVCLCASAAIGWFSGRKSVQDRGSKVWSPIAQEVDEV